MTPRSAIYAIIFLMKDRISFFFFFEIFFIGYTRPGEWLHKNSCYYQFPASDVRREPLNRLGYGRFGFLPNHPYWVKKITDYQWKDTADGCNRKCLTEYFLVMHLRRSWHEKERKKQTNKKYVCMNEEMCNQLQVPNQTTIPYMLQTIMNVNLLYSPSCYYLPLTSKS